jgi:magnesium transporter
MSEANTTTAAAACLLGQRAGFRWFHVEDVHGPALDQLAAEFGLHELAIEDCRNERQRAKVEGYENHIFVIVNTVHFDPDKCECWFGEFDVFVGRDFLISVHDGPSRTMRAVRPKFEADAKMSHPGRLLYTLLDYVADRYLPVLDSIEDRIEALEEEVHKGPSTRLIAEIFAIRRALIDYRRVATSMREVINQLLRRTEPWLRSQGAYFRNIYDHYVRALDFVEAYRDILTGVLDVHLTATANRTNEIVKALTVYATLALPFLIITSFFGMNFHRLPLLNHPYGGLYVTGGMLALAGGLLWFFKRRGWF